MTVPPLKRINRLKQFKYNKDALDMDYLNKLSPEEREFMAKFLEDHYMGKGSNRYKRELDVLNKATLSSAEEGYERLNEDDPESILIAKETQAEWEASKEYVDPNVASLPTSQPTKPTETK